MTRSIYGTSIGVVSVSVFLLVLCLIVPAAAVRWRWKVPDSSYYAGLFSSLALDSSDKPHISHYDDTNKDLKYTHWNGSSWQTERVDSEGTVGGYTSLALDSSDNPHISYYDGTNKDLKYTRWDGSAWQTETVDFTDDVGGYTSLALDSSDNPHISYYDGTNKDLKYTRWDGSAWQTETVDSTGSVGGYTSLALDSSDNPRISYYGPLLRVGFAYFDGTNWDISTVQEAGRNYTSIAVDSTGHTHISYFYWHLREPDVRLEYTWWDVPPSAFSLVSPTDGATVHSWPLVDWEDSKDAFPGTVTYELWYSTNDTFSGGCGWVGNLTKSEYQFVAGELQNDTTYYWKVAARDSYHVRTWSTETWSFYVAEGVGVSIETVELASQTTDDGVLLNWSIVGDEPASMSVLRSVDENLPIALSGELSGSETNWLDASAEAGVEYAYYLEVTELDGTVTRFGPSEVVVPAEVCELTLSDPYPNPASDALTVSYELATAGSVSLSVYDLSGRLVETLVSGDQTAGRHSVSWNSSEEATGVYLLRLEAAGEAITKRAVISR